MLSALRPGGCGPDQPSFAVARAVAYVQPGRVMASSGNARAWGRRVGGSGHFACLRAEAGLFEGGLLLYKNFSNSLGNFSLEIFLVKRKKGTSREGVNPPRWMLAHVPVTATRAGVARESPETVSAETSPTAQNLCAAGYHSARHSVKKALLKPKALQLRPLWVPRELHLRGELVHCKCGLNVGAPGRRARGDPLARGHAHRSGPRGLRHKW